jgi:hypothetical protein
MDFFAQNWFLLVLGGIGLITVISLVMKWQAGRLRVFLPAFDNHEARTTVFFASKMSGMVRGQPATVIFYPKDKNHPHRREVRMTSTRSDAWRITPKGLALLEISFTPKVKTNDPHWDEKYVVRSKSPEAVLYLLGDGKKKEAVELLMALPEVRHLTAKGGMLRVFQSHIGVKDTTVADLQTVFDILGRLNY